MHRTVQLPTCRPQNHRESLSPTPHEIQHTPLHLPRRFVRAQVNRSPSSRSAAATMHPDEAPILHSPGSLKVAAANATSCRLLSPQHCGLWSCQRPLTPPTTSRYSPPTFSPLFPPFFTIFSNHTTLYPLCTFDVPFQSPDIILTLIMTNLLRPG